MSSSNLTVTIEPSEDGIAHFLKCAPPITAGNEAGYLNLFLTIRNNGSSGIHINKIEVSVVGSSTAAKPFTTDLTMEAGGTASWVQTEDYVFAIPAHPTLRLKFFDGSTQLADVLTTLVPHASPTPEGSYRFWGEVRDLRPGEYWQLHGTSHSQDNSAQLYAYDVGVAVDDASAQAGHNILLPGTDGSKNEHHRIWNKPIYAIADGTVTDFRYYFPTNPIPGLVPAELEMFWTPPSQGGLGKDGNGNFFTITTGNETVLYAHMRTNSLNPKLLSKGAVVKKGDFLGLAGNSGASGGPHLHIHANRINTGAQSWVDAPRPMPFHNAHAVAWASLGQTAAGGLWVKLSGRGIPVKHCAVWPSDSRAVDLSNVTIRHFTISEGQVWVVKSDNKIRTTSESLKGSGVFLDLDPLGSAKEIALRGHKPYIIGMDDKIWEGLPNGWSPLSNSPTCKRITVDATSGRLWMVALNTRIWSYNPPTGSWAEHPGGGSAKDICVLRGVPHIIGMDDRVWKSASLNGWTRLPGAGAGKRIASDNDNDKLWIVNMNNGIWSHDGDGTWTEHPMGGLARDIFIYQGTPYIIGSDDGLWKSAGKFGWQKLNLVEPK
ncbi:MAG TPA: M23 family metallopeptidase [Pyrinomonadaceae bacterium]|jgi:hypothetical protein